MRTKVIAIAILTIVMIGTIVVQATIQYMPHADNSQTTGACHRDTGRA